MYVFGSAQLEGAVLRLQLLLSIDPNRQSNAILAAA
jgi:hypothetical protein